MIKICRKLNNSLLFWMFVAVAMFVSALYTPAFAMQYSEPGIQRHDDRIQEWKLIVKSNSPIQAFRTRSGIAHLSKSTTVCMSKTASAGNLMFGSYFDSTSQSPEVVYTKGLRDAVTLLILGRCDLAVVPESFLIGMGGARKAVRAIAPLVYRKRSRISSIHSIFVADGRAETYVPDVNEPEGC